MSSGRIVITSEGVIHDMRADGTLENGVNDVAGPNLDQSVRVVAVFNGGRLDLHTPSASRQTSRRW
jgi:hypothetical protein